MKVSVIIPVYNASAFIAAALQSVLIQKEVVECIVVDDGCTDKSLHIIEEFASQDKRIIVLHHPKRANLGPGPARNLGLKTATQEYVAFLDADDYWKENRFAETQRLFSKHADADGVYEARATEDWNGEIDNSGLTMIRTNPIPDKVFFSYSPFGNDGFFALIGLTVKRKVIDEIGYFSNTLWLTQDTEWMTKLSLKCKLFGGIIHQPVAIRRFHRDNSSRDIERLKRSRVNLCIALLHWAVRENRGEDVKEILTKVLLKYHYELNNLSDKDMLTKKRSDISLLIKLWRIDPALLKDPRVKYFRNLIFHLTVKQSFDFYE
ncbi:glycosyltransferase family 2 protein [Cryomorpha ignava]|uniref:Glycosyltransferase family 2 protein n=1 Tax=Cryomorpha ignava TaxID=101383 RepID=A0A7K3WQV4_9FLAO|nr:glycosyltransferase family 2 protein [Cryomorpha ignava]NEN24060.1 glycosyltransferase family 2 protein [Cryomorpha ignava]